MIKGFVVILVVVNLLIFGLGQGWFGAVRSDAGRDPALARDQLNANAIIVLETRASTP